MKKYLLIVLLIGFCLGQSDSEPKRSEIITERHENGLKKLVFVYQGEGLDEVLVAKYGFYDNGLKAFIANYKNNLLHGEYNEWHFNGQKAAKGFYKENLAENNFKTWYENGNLNEEIIYQNGKKNGKYIQRDYEGEIISEGIYIDDLEDGEWVYKNGNKVIVNFIKGNKEGKYQEFKNNILVVKGYYANDEKVKKWTYYHDNGNIQSEGLFLKNYKNGEWISFDSLGTKISSQVFENGKTGDLPFREFYNDGTIKLNGQFYRGYKSGKWEYFDKTGFKTDQKTFSNDKLNGLHVRYYGRNSKEVTEYAKNKKNGIWQVWEDGKLSYDGNYKDDKRAGIWKSFDDDGETILSKTDYTNPRYNFYHNTDFIYKDESNVLIGEIQNFQKKVKGTKKTESYKVNINYYENGNLKSKKSYIKKIGAWDKRYPEHLYAKSIKQGKYLVLNEDGEVDSIRFYSDYAKNFRDVKASNSGELYIDNPLFESKESKLYWDITEDEEKYLKPYKNKIIREKFDQHIDILKQEDMFELKKIRAKLKDTYLNLDYHRTTYIRNEDYFDVYFNEWAEYYNKWFYKNKNSLRYNRIYYGDFWINRPDKKYRKKNKKRYSVKEISGLLELKKKEPFIVMLLKKVPNERFLNWKSHSIKVTAIDGYNRESNPSYSVYNSNKDRLFGKERFESGETKSFFPSGKYTIDYISSQSGNPQFLDTMVGIILDKDIDIDDNNIIRDHKESYVINRYSQNINHYWLDTVDGYKRETDKYGIIYTDAKYSSLSLDETIYPSKKDKYILVEMITSSKKDEFEFNNIEPGSYKIIAFNNNLNSLKYEEHDLGNIVKEPNKDKKSFTSYKLTPTTDKFREFKEQKSLEWDMYEQFYLTRYLRRNLTLSNIKLSEYIEDIKNWENSSSNESPLESD